MTISTHSPRAGRTGGYNRALRYAKNFNSLAPCGANRYVGGSNANGESISTHSPRAGRTFDYNIKGFVPIHFNSLAPCGANL